MSWSCNQLFLLTLEVSLFSVALDISMDGIDLVIAGIWWFFKVSCKSVDQMSVYEMACLLVISLLVCNPIFLGQIYDLVKGMHLIDIDIKNIWLIWTQQMFVCVGQALKEFVTLSVNRKKGFPNWGRQVPICNDNQHGQS